MSLVDRMNHLRVGVIGTSWWADGMFLPSLKSHPRARIAALCGRSRARADELAHKYDIPRVFTDYRAMIDSGELDAVVVAAPDDEHYPMTMAALDAGLHVLCEKPLAMNAQQARAMRDKAQAVGVKHMVMFTNRWLPAYRFVRELIEQQAVGRPFDFSLVYLTSFARGGDYKWRFDRAHGSGALGDIASHMLDLARWYLGEVAQLSAQLGTFVTRQRADAQAFDAANDTATLLLRFANGALGAIHVSAVAHRPAGLLTQQLRLHGADGTLEADLLPVAQQRIRVARSGEPDARTLDIPAHLFGDAPRDNPSLVFGSQSAGARAFVDAILDGTPLTPNFDDGLKVQQLIDAAVESDATGRWVTLA